MEEFVGQKLFIRTVTYHLVGKVERVLGGGVLELSEASWVADSGRFNKAIGEGTLSEVEVVGQAFVNMASITDFFPWKHELPTTSK
jgi:hypothetical protein